MMRVELVVNSFEFRVDVFFGNFSPLPGSVKLLIGNCRVGASCRVVKLFNEISFYIRTVCRVKLIGF